MAEEHSPYFINLSKNIATIEHYCLLKRDKESTDPYTEEEEILINSYILLTHAEIESYFEEIAKQTVQAAWDKWKSEYKAGVVLLSVISFMSKQDDVPTKLSKLNGRPYEGSVVETRIKDSVGKYYEKISKNNGIKEDNLLGILLPIGIKEENLDPIFLATMTSLGLDRGSIAHKPIGAERIINPFDKKKEIANILEEIKKIEVLITKLV